MPSLNEKSRFYSPVALGAASQALIFGSGAPDGSIAPQADAKKGSLYLRDDMTTDQSGVYVKVDTANADDDWVQVIVDKDEDTYTMEGDWTWGTSKKIYFRDAGLYLYSPSACALQVTIGTTSQFLVSGGSGVRLEGTALAYEYISLGPHQFDVSTSGSVTCATIRNTATGSFPALNFAGCALLAAYSDFQRVPSNAASSGSVAAIVVWSGSTDGDAAVFQVGYDYVVSGSGPGTTTGCIIVAGSCVSASELTSTTAGCLPSFTAGQHYAIRLLHDGTSGSDDSGSTTDVATVVLRYVVDRLGEKT